jgi:hypothetical protein
MQEIAGSKPEKDGNANKYPLDKTHVAHDKDGEAKSKDLQNQKLAKEEPISQHQKSTF